MRSFIRHDTDLPIEVKVESHSPRSEALRNVSQGGLSFRHHAALPVGAEVRVAIAVAGSGFEAPCRVVWCQPEGEAWQVGVVFVEPEDLFRARMIEQVCQIEQYREEHQRSGRQLSGQEAALEWIGKFAAGFPRLGE
jgi:PilZ domain